MSDKIFNKAHEIWIKFNRVLKEVFFSISHYITCLPELLPFYIDLFRVSIELQKKRFELGRYISLNKENKYDYSKDIDFNSMKDHLDKIILHREIIRKDISNIVKHKSD